MLHQDVAKKANGASAGNFQMNNVADFSCPLTGLQMNGRCRFSALRNTGHVISEKALKEVMYLRFVPRQHSIKGVTSSSRASSMLSLVKMLIQPRIWMHSLRESGRPCPPTE